MLARRNGERAPEGQLKVAGLGKIKESYSYVCQDIVREFRKYDEEPHKYFERYEGEPSVTGGCVHVYNGTQIVHPSNLSLKITASTLATSASLPARSS